jgi:hypothetical protein
VEGPVSATRECEEFVDLAAALAVNALDAGECTKVEQHAKDCPDCGKILEQFREAAAALGAAVPQVDPPAALRTRVLLAARSVRPQPVARDRRLLAFLRRPRLSAAWLVAAASMLVSVVALAWVVMLNNQVVELRASVAAEAERAARYDHIVEVLASPQLAIRPLRPSGGQPPQMSGVVYLDPQSRTGMLTAHELPPLKPGRAWQVWFTCGTERVSGGMFWPDRYGNAYSLITLPQDIQSCESMNITEEPVSGSKWPTSPGTMWGRLRED